MSNPTQTQQVLAQGKAHHAAGRFKEAEAIYRRIFAAEPNNPDVLNLLGAVLYQTGRGEEAAKLVTRSVAIKTTFGNLSNLGEILRALGKTNDAITCLRRSIELNPNFPDSYTNLALAMMDVGKLQEAEKLFDRGTQVGPQRADLFIRLCTVRQRLNDATGAVIAGRKAVQLAPQSAEAWSNLARALALAKNNSEALQASNRAIELAPQHADAYIDLSHVHERAGRIADAEAALQKAIALNPKYSLAHRNLAALMDKNNFPEKAVDPLVRALELQPNDFHGWNNLATIRRRLRDFPGALDAVERALKLDPNHPSAHGCRGLLLLAMGDYERGFVEYEWRWRCEDFTTAPRDFGKPMWDGVDPAGRTILVHTEQGFGDTLQFARYLPMLADRGAKIILECAPPLFSLLGNMKSVSRVIPTGMQPGDFELHIPLLSLPRIFGTTLQTVPTDVPYLSPDPQRLELWKNRIASASAGFKVGLIWAGNVKPDPARTCPPEKLSPLAEVPGVTFIALQKRDEVPESEILPPGLNIIDMGPHLRDFSDTAAAMMNLDLIVTIDTSAAHLAGALGRPTWTMLPWAADWRWMEDREDTPWYPTMRLFRQPVRGDWTPVIGRITQELGKLALSEGRS